MENIYGSIEDLSNAKGIDPQVVIEAVKDAILAAARKYYKTNGELVAEFRDRAIRVRRVGGAATVAARIPEEDCWAVLIDRAHDRLYGGSGESWDYAAAADLALTQPGGRSRRVFIAGGIGPANIAQVAAAVPGAYAVDTCSGVESSPGHKDRAKLEQLFANLAEGAAR